ncbi:MAG: phospho-sugar mutase [Clostridia bacterium]|jgi:phosphoglucomutase|nr:phospho-sugar mutase [Clostridia bacterium]
MEYMKKYEDWCNNEKIDEKTKKELKDIKNNLEEIKDRFYKDLEFGTAGLRGIIGAGTNRMNQYTVTKATQGISNYIIKKGLQNKGVAISYDSRNMSKEFSEQTALCLNANGIKTYIFNELKPVPELSFTVRKLGCVAGIMITASHNPPKYNGYKVYWQDGAQIVSPIDKEIIEEVKKVQKYEDIKSIEKEEAIKKGLYNIIDEKIEDKYIEELKKQISNPEIIKQMQEDIKIVYTPLHGTGNIPVRKVLKELGFTKLYIVPEQEKPDGNFPTIEYPNPEDKKAFKLALELAKQKDADLVLATDPDADRLGVYAKDKTTGEYKEFTGNMSSILIAEYILSQKKDKNVLPKNAAIIKSIVSTNMAEELAKHYKISLYTVLTGFKYIGEKIKQFEETKENEYIFGFEESYGCLAGTYARDKDGIEAVMLLCEAAAFYKKQGYTLWDQMINLYKKYGYYKEGIASITMEGAQGAEKIKQIMENLRKNPPKKFGNYKILKIKDYLTRECNNKVENKITKIDLPTSNVLYYDLQDNSWCCVRPSGTEPKIKFYIGIKGNSMEDSQEKIESLKRSVLEIIK